MDKKEKAVTKLQRLINENFKEKSMYIKLSFKSPEVSRAEHLQKTNS